LSENSSSKTFRQGLGSLYRKITSPEFFDRMPFDRTPFDQTTFDRMPFDRKFILPKYHMTDFFLRKWSFGRIYIEKKSQLTEKN
jgi:hypothetical protein